MEHQNFAAKLHQLSRLLSTLHEHRWASDGYDEIKIGHIHPIVQLAERNFTNNQLAETARVTKQSMNRLTNELIATGYISLAGTQTTDGRMKLLTLTAKGKKFVAYLNTTKFDLENKLSSLLTEDTFRELNQTIDKLLAFTEERNRMIK